MKTFIRIFAILALLALTICAASCGSARTPEQKAADQRLDSIAGALAVKNLEACCFLIPAETISFGHRATRATDNRHTNFVAADGQKCIVQISSMSNPRPGVNGLGGISVEGNIRLLRHDVDKRGTHTFEYTLKGGAVSGRIIVTLPKESVRATARMTGNFHSGNITMMGNVQPYDKLEISVGRTI